MRPVVPQEAQGAHPPQGSGKQLPFQALGRALGDGGGWASTELFIRSDGSSLSLFLKRFYYIYFYREGEEGRKRGRETLPVETSVSHLSPMARLGPGSLSRRHPEACTLVPFGAS